MFKGKYVQGKWKLSHLAKESVLLPVQVVIVEMLKKQVKRQ
jgi:hypothetical protein